MTVVANLAKAIKSRRHFVRLFWVGTLLVNLFVVGVVALVIVESREREERQAVALTENYSRILEEALAGFLSKIDITLLTVSDEIARQMSHGGIDETALEAFLAQQDRHIPEALGLRVVDAQGIIRYAVNDIRVSNVSIADRPQFIRLRDDPEAGLVFSKPMMGRAAEKWLITLGRRINNPDGTFAGDVHVAVAVDHFIAMFSRINLGPQGNIGLWDHNSLIARYARNDAHGATVGNATPSDQLRALLDSDQKAAAYHARSGVDGITRAFYFRQVANYPLHLIVGLADEDYLAQWRADSLRIAGLAGLFVIATLLVALLADRGWRRREADQQALLEQKAAYAAQLERSSRDAEAARRHSDLILVSAGEGICGVDLEGKVVFVNPAARQMFGWDEDEGIGLDLHSQTHHHKADGSIYPRSDCPIFKTLNDGQRRQVKDNLYWRKDGTPFPVEFTVAAMEQDGKISGAVNVFRDITARKKLEERIMHMAMFDELTGLPNRSFLSDALRRIAALTVRRHEEAGILYVDLDGFKCINDRMGHAAGDLVLREVAARLGAGVRAEDVVARLGGDEFLVVTQTGSENAREHCIALAQRLIDAVSQPIFLPGGMAEVGASVGIAIFSERESSIERCIQKADAAMYQAKKAGKGSYALADPAEESPVPETLRSD